jgi:hypothetical protein
MPVTADRAEMYKHVVTLLSLDEAVTFGIVKPLYRTDFTLGHKHTPLTLNEPLLGAVSTELRSTAQLTCAPQKCARYPRPLTAIAARFCRTSGSLPQRLSLRL